MKRVTDNILAANEAQAADASDAISFPVFFAVNEVSASGKWCQLSPFGTFPNQVGKQVFGPADGQAVCNEFNSLPNIGAKAIGLPLYVGHPDHPSFAGKYSDSGAKGRFKSLVVRHDPACAKCAAFAANEYNPATSPEPCSEHGLFGLLKLNSEGKSLAANEEYHGLSVNWRMKKQSDGQFHPFSLKSVGLTNEPGIPVPAITAANEKALMIESEKQAANSNISNGKSADNQTGIAKKPGLMQRIAGLLKKPDLGKEGANEDDAGDAMEQYAANADKTAADFADLQAKHADLTAKHGVLKTMCNSVMKAYGANEKGELPEPVVKRAGKALTDENIVEFAANEIPVLAAAVAKGTTDLTAANEKISKLEADAANERKQRDSDLLDVLVTGGFVTGAEQKDYAAKLAANETRDAAVKALLALKPKISTVSTVGALGHVSAEVVAANQQQNSRIEAIIEAVNEVQAKHLKDHGKKLDYAKAFQAVQRTRKELFKDDAENITR